MIVETDSSPTTFCPTPVKNIPYPRAKRTNGKGGTPGQRPPLSHLPEESARIVWSWASFVFASEREALDTLALRFTEPHGPRPHCPLCGAAMVMDGGPGKERCERHPSSKQFRCKECARKLAFTSTLEGTVATALLAVRDLLIAQWLPTSRALRVWAVCRIIGALAQPLNQPVAIIHLDGSHRGGRVVIGLVPPGESPRFLIAPSENSDDAKNLIRSAVGGDGEDLVVVSDGGVAIRKAVREALPACVHIRQFHGEWRGLVAIHWCVGGDQLTLLIPWDLLSEEKTGMSQGKALAAEPLLFHGDIVHPSTAARMTGGTPAHTFIFALAALQADQLLHELEGLAEADDSFAREGSNTSLFTRKYNAVVKLLRLLPEEEREAVLVLLRGALERVAEGVKPALKRVGRRWRRTIKNAGYLRGDSTFREAVNRAVSALPAPNLREMRKKGKTQRSVSDKKRRESPAMPKNKRFLLAKGGLEELRKRFPELLEPAVEALETFRSVVITNNRMENVWSHLGGTRGYLLLVAALARITLGVEGLIETLTTTAITTIS